MHGFRALTVGRHFIFHDYYLVVCACDLAVDVQLELRNEAFLHQAEEGFVLVILVLLGLVGFRQKLLFFL